MLVPRFSIRVLLAATTAAAFAALVISFAVRGQPWAIAVTVMMASLLVVFSIHVALFLTARAVAQLWRGRRKGQAVSDTSDNSEPDRLAASALHEVD